MRVSKENLTEIVRLAYLAGGFDSMDHCFKYCNQGSKERAEELIKEDDDFMDLNK